MRIKHNRLHRRSFFLLAVTLACVILLSGIQTTARAAEEDYTVSVHGMYRHPESGKIEDSGGESSYALGQSMVESVVDSVGLLQASDGTWVLSLRFHLMDSISKVSLTVQESGKTNWSETDVQETGSGEETKDFCVLLPAKQSVIRAECFVDVMGRSVVFYITYDNLTTGNTTDFREIPFVEKKPEAQDKEMVSSGGKAADIILDDSFWRVVFSVSFGAAFCAGGVLLVMWALIRSLMDSRKKKREDRLRRFDFVDNEDLNDDFILDFEDETEGGRDA